MQTHFWSERRASHLALPYFLTTKLVELKQKINLQNIFQTVLVPTNL